MSNTNTRIAGGGAISRQLSNSLQVPSTLTGYQDFFRKNSNLKEDGWLETMTSKDLTDHASARHNSDNHGESISSNINLHGSASGVDQGNGDGMIGLPGSNGNTGWKKSWVVYENGTLSVGPGKGARPEDCLIISMDRVISFRTEDAAFGETTIIVTTMARDRNSGTREQLRMRASSKDEMHRWLFCFQKSVALVLSNLIESSSTSRPLTRENAFGPYGGLGSSVHTSSPLMKNVTQNTIWLSELGHGHGKHSHLAKRRNSSENKSVSPSASEHLSSKDRYIDGHSLRFEENITDLRGMSRSVNSETGQYTTTPQRNIYNAQDGNRISVAVSPAIPIMSVRYDSSSSDRVEVLAGSPPASPPSSTIRCLSLSPERSPNHTRRNSVISDDSEDQGVSRDDEDEESGLIFDLDDEGREDTTKNDVNVSRKEKGVGEDKGTSRIDCASSVTSVSSRLSAGISSDQTSSPKPALMWTSGYCTKIGPRESQEDRLVAIPDLSKAIGEDFLCGDKARHGFFAVYDGHCGSQASEHLQEHLHTLVCKHPSYLSDIEKAVTDTCIAVDSDFLAMSRAKKQFSGTTALGAFIRDDHLCVFNIGDCNAFLSSNGECIEMSKAHKPGREDEAERIRAAGGWITEEKELYMGRLHRMDLSDPLVKKKAEQVNWVTIHRVCGELAVSRSIGDPDYKTLTPGAKADAFFLWPDGHNQVFQADLVIPNPEFHSMSVTAKDEFLVIASDGLWDVMSGPEAILHIRDAFRVGKTPSETAEELCDLAIKLGSSDNVTIVLVLFVHNNPNDKKT